MVLGENPFFDLAFRKGQAAMRFTTPFWVRMRFLAPFLIGAVFGKHAISFEEVKAMGEDEDRLELPARSVTEDRYALLARREGTVWAAFFTRRGDSIRIISVPRARDHEARLFDEG